MQEDELGVLIAQMAALAAQMTASVERFEQRCDRIEQRQDALAQQQSAAFNQKADDLLDTVSGRVSSTAREGLEPVAADYRQSLRSSATEIVEGTKALTQQIVQLQRPVRHVMWKLSGVVILTLALLLAGAIWLSMHYMQVIRDNQLSAELLKAYNGADVRVCGESQLCANVDVKGARIGDHKQYFVVRPR
jgi:hypothetical protein